MCSKHTFPLQRVAYCYILTNAEKMDIHSALYVWQTLFVVGCFLSHLFTERDEDAFKHLSVAVMHIL